MSNNILEAAKALLPYLKDCGAEAIEPQLIELIEKGEAGQSMNIPIGKLVRNHDKAKLQFDALLKKRQSGEEIRSYSPLPGDSSAPVATSEYVCPKEGGCTCGKYPTGWDRHSIEDAIPICPKLEQPLILNSAEYSVSQLREIQFSYHLSIN